MAEPQKIEYRTTTLPDYLDKPYQEYMGLYGGQVAADLKGGMPEYGKERIAGLSEVQQNAMNQALGMQPSQQLNAATGLMGSATANALNTNYTPGQYDAQSFGNQVGNYMSPYTQGVVDIQQREAQRQADIAGTSRNAQAVKSGAFGGSRQAIMDAEANRNLAIQKGDIQAKGLQDAFTQASNQYNVGNQLSEQSRQYGAGLGLQGQQAAMQGAGALGTLGNLQYQQQMGINQLQQGYGGMQQNIEQQRMNTGYQDFLNKQNYPYQLLNQYGNVLNKQPANMNMQQTTYGQSPSLGGQLIGTAGALATSPAAKNIFGFADGGMVQHYEGGGAIADSRDVTDESYIAKLIEKLSLPQLQAILGNPAAPRMQKQLAADQIEELQRLQASAQNGLYGAAQNTPSIDEMYPAEDTAYGANGGIVAFAEGGDEGKKYNSVIGKEIMEGLSNFFSKLNPSNAGYTEEITQPEAAVEKSRGLQQTAREVPTVKPPPAPPTPDKQKETPYDSRTATRKENYPKGLPNIGSSDLKGLTSALRSAPSSYKDEVLAAAKEFSKGDEEVNAKLEDLLGKDKKRSEDFKNDSSRMYLNQLFSGIAKAASKPGEKGFRGVMTAVSESAGNMPEYEATLRKQQDQYDLLAQKNEVDNLKYKVALKDRNFDKALGLEKAIKDNQFQMQQLQQQAADNAARIQLGMAQLAQSGRQHEGMLDIYKQRIKATEGANKVRMAGMEAKVMPMFQSDPNTRKLAKQLEDKYGKNWQSQPGPQAEYYRSYETFKARTMPSLVAESESGIPSNYDL
jgi:hypothetical protein